MEIQASRSRARVERVRRADAAARSESRALGSPSDPPRACRARTGRGARAALRPLRAPGRNRRLSCSRAHRKETDWARIAALYDALSELSPSPVVELEPRRRGRHGVGSRRRPEARRHAQVRAGALGIPPAVERARRPPGETGPPRRGEGGVRACGFAHAKCSGAQTPSRPRGPVRNSAPDLTFPTRGMVRS